jgi:hypothetical protein
MLSLDVSTNHNRGGIGQEIPHPSLLRVQFCNPLSTQHFLGQGARRPSETEQEQCQLRLCWKHYLDGPTLRYM